MRKLPTFIAVLLTVSTAGCVLSGKAKTPTPAAPVVAKPAPTPTPPQPAPALSIPQTQVELPRYQPVDPAALAAETPAAPPPIELPDPPAPVRNPAPGRGRPTQATPPAATPPVTTPEPAAPQIGEIVPPGEAKRLQEQAQARRRDVQQILDQLGRRQLSGAQRSVITNINSFLNSSADAERRGDMKLADALADRAQILAKDLINGK